MKKYFYQHLSKRFGISSTLATINSTSTFMEQKRKLPPKPCGSQSAKRQKQKKITYLQTTHKKSQENLRREAKAFLKTCKRWKTKALLRLRYNGTVNGIYKSV
jgi:hypothetical protein